MNYIILKEIKMYSCDDKAEFSAALLQWTSSEEIILICWFGAQKTFLLLSIFKTNIFTKTMNFLDFFDEQKVKKKK